MWTYNVVLPMPNNFWVSLKSYWKIQFTEYMMSIIATINYCIDQNSRIIRKCGFMQNLIQLLRTRFSWLNHTVKQWSLNAPEATSSSLPSLRAANASFASSKENTVLFVLTWALGASSRNSTGSCLVKLATNTTYLSPHKMEYGNARIWDMWIPPATTSPT